MTINQTATPAAADRKTAWIVSGLLLLAVVLVFGQTLTHGFVNFDDDEYVYQNPHVFRGLSWEGLLWSLTHFHAANWHPLTWLSHMADCQFFGLWAGGHHLTSMAIHAATALLLFVVWHRMTGDLWPSAWVAAVFAIHPQHVESVAWVAERKDVLSGLFFVLTLAAYVGYVRQPFSLARYGLLMVSYAAGLLCKPMLVTLPCVLLLLDFWPLDRFHGIRPGTTAGPPTMPRRPLGRLVLEKLPLLALAMVSSGVTLSAQQSAIVSEERIGYASRIANGLVSYVVYLGQFFYPSGLTVLYLPPTQPLPTWKVVGAAIVLAAVSLLAAASWRRWPHVLVGWLWYLGMLVPVIGVVQVGRQAMADRYMYLPQIGLLVILAWAAQQAYASWPILRREHGIATAVLLSGLMACAWWQTGHWRNGESLWRHVLSHDRQNHVAMNNLANMLASRRRFEEALDLYRSAVKLSPNYADAHFNLGNALTDLGRHSEAADHYRNALALHPDDVESRSKLENALRSCTPQTFRSRAE